MTEFPLLAARGPLRIHAMPSVLLPGRSPTLCGGADGREAVDPRCERGAGPWPLFADVRAANRCERCAQRVAWLNSLTCEDSGS